MRIWLDLTNRRTSIGDLLAKRRQVYEPILDVLLERPVTARTIVERLS